MGRASVPSGASTGQYEAVELRDGGERYGGKGVQNAVEHVNTILADCIIGENIYQQAEIDRKLIRADGSENKSHLGANAVLGVSMAVAHAAAKSLEIPLFRYLQAPRPCAFRYRCSTSSMEAATPGAPWIFRNLC